MGRTVTANPLSTRLKRAVHRPSKRPAPTASASAQASSVGLSPAHSTIQLRAPQARPFSAVCKVSAGRKSFICSRQARRLVSYKVGQAGQRKAGAREPTHTSSYPQGRPQARCTPATAPLRRSGRGRDCEGERCPAGGQKSPLPCRMHICQARGLSATRPRLGSGARLLLSCAMKP